MVLRGLGLLLSLALVGCSAVESRQPMGLEPATDVAEQLQGVWLHGDDVVCMTHMATGVCALAYVENSKRGLDVTTYQLVLRCSPRRLYANLGKPDDNPATTATYCFALLDVRDADHCTVVLPRVAAFAEAVARGALAGTTSSADNVSIDCTPAQFETFLDSVVASNLWRVEEPRQLVRMKPTAK